jgi:YVTN family beta-propeller protein
MKRLAVLCTFLLASTAAVALPTEHDRVYTADQNSNTVSVIDPVGNTLLGQIRLGNPRPDILSPLYKGEVNVHGLGFSPDHKTLVAVSTVTNSVTFIDTATNAVKGTAYIGRNPHEAFFTPDGRQVWATVRGEDHLAVIDAATHREVGRIPTTSGPGMTIFAPDGSLAFVCNSFNPVVEVVDVARREVIKRIPVVSPFSPFLQVTPDGSEVWLTHKDVGKVTRIDTKALEVKGTIDTGPITNHLAFGQSGGRTLVYVTVGGENAVKVFTMEATPALVKTIPVGALPHGIWASGDSGRIYVGLENGDAVDVIDTSKNETIARIPVGQAPQALVFVSDAIPPGADGRANLTARPSGPETLNIALKAPQGAEGAGSVVSRNLGLVDILEVSVSRLKPDTVYSVFLEGRGTPVAVLKTNPRGMGMVSTTGPTREIRPGPAGNSAETSSRVIVIEGEGVPAGSAPALAGG